MRLQLRGGEVTVRALIRHPMAIGGRLKSGVVIAAHFITEVTCTHNGTVVMRAHWGPGIAKNPYLSFVVGHASSGDELIIRWIDNIGESDEFKTKI
jgi:sulfur-oxidizing protein SoxZ